MPMMRSWKSDFSASTSVIGVVPRTFGSRSLFAFAFTFGNHATKLEGAISEIFVAEASFGPFEFRRCARSLLRGVAGGCPSVGHAFPPMSPSEDEMTPMCKSVMGAYSSLIVEELRQLKSEVAVPGSDANAF